MAAEAAGRKLAAEVSRREGKRVGGGKKQVGTEAGGGGGKGEGVGIARCGRARPPDRANKQTTGQANEQNNYHTKSEKIM